MMGKAGLAGKEEVGAKGYPWFGSGSSAGYFIYISLIYLQPIDLE
jgi:hypothetical protein